MKIFKTVYVPTDVNPKSLDVFTNKGCIRKPKWIDSVEERQNVYVLTKDQLTDLLSKCWDECEIGKNMEMSMHVNAGAEPNYIPLDKETWMKLNFPNQ
jgi:hypothetical protein